MSRSSDGNGGGGGVRLYAEPEQGRDISLVYIFNMLGKYTKIFSLYLFIIITIGNRILTYNNSKRFFPSETGRDQ